MPPVQPGHVEAPHGGESHVLKDSWRPDLILQRGVGHGNGGLCRDSLVSAHVPSGVPEGIADLAGSSSAIFTGSERASLLRLTFNLTTPWSQIPYDLVAQLVTSESAVPSVSSGGQRPGEEGAGADPQINVGVLCPSSLRLPTSESAARCAITREGQGGSPPPAGSRRDDGDAGASHWRIGGTDWRACCSDSKRTIENPVPSTAGSSPSNRRRNPGAERSVGRMSLVSAAAAAGACWGSMVRGDERAGWMGPQFDMSGIQRLRDHRSWLCPPVPRGP